MFSSRLQELIDEFGGKKLTGFAKLCGIPQGTLHGYKSGKLPTSEYLIRIQEECGVSIDWLLKGRGEKYIDNQGQPKIQLDPDPRIASLMEGARRVLTSGNILAFHALEQNIIYFDHAIAAEKRADATERKIQEIREDFKILKSEIKRLTRENLRLDMEAEEQSSNKKVA
ncbi:MAG: helix-turn-helix domain containing protein [Proteobacteria bacterium]|nr:helix-turn-helix domain containing protein [Pseudomonadota bacterium]